MKNKLELTWYNKDKSLYYDLKEGKYIWVDRNDPRVAEPRILIEKKHYGDPAAENLLIKGDNLLALKALQPEFTEKIKVVYIDPPFNTGAAFEHYDDGLEHSIWLTMMRDRLMIIKELLSDDGSIYLHLDWNEVHYAKILMDEIFGRRAFQREVIWRIGWISGYKSKAKNYIRNHDTILYYTKNPDKFIFNKIYIPYAKDYKRRDGSKPKGKGYPMEDTWNCSEIDKLDSIQIKSFSGEKTGFLTQKNEHLLKRMIEVSSNKGDWVLDSFAGSGTTGAVAHKLGRNWIMIELTDNVDKFCLKRMKKIVDGKDERGISKEIGWEGGGGFKYCILGESLFEFDTQIKFPFINTTYTNGPLIRAICKMEGFHVISTKGPLHGQVNKRYAHITEQFVNQAYIEELKKEITDEDSLAVYCLKHESKIDSPDNVSIKRMPMVLAKKFAITC
ncbi:MAG: site-specific DNA-methyltransferase [Candidatus Omnitrophica bacterium]|nr:site-specific DNA-methyltransferase [Candidatus Omnitrophota bacterium]